MNPCLLFSVSREEGIASGTNKKVDGLEISGTNKKVNGYLIAEL